MKNKWPCIALLLLLCACSKRELHMPSKSMEPAIPAGATVLVDFSAYEEREVERGDLVCFRPEEYPDVVFVFRVAGLPTETIRLSGSTIFANGKPTEIDGIEDSPTDVLSRSVTLGRDEFYVLGDNTSVARDSRYFGPIKRDQILGKVTKIQPVDAGNDG